jgi:hypothetical protein
LRDKLARLLETFGDLKLFDGLFQLTGLEPKRRLDGGCPEMF